MQFALLVYESPEALATRNNGGMRWLKARLTITSIWWKFPARKLLESASFTRIRVAAFSTLIPATLAGPNTLSILTTI